ncbi:hypothetical protein [Halovivax cerinus]|uniref:DUF2065 domain-containing protein n=1 Tax=Halovivax cerinus TaxID=1487865 RepID=A0ABD5NK89_9EURY|nr:hypothetical protein [Halovivax cerinus]
MWLLALGVGLAALGASGVVFAPRMIELRREEGMIDDDAAQITDDDRVLVTRAMGAVFLIVGLFLVFSRLSG